MHDLPPTLHEILAGRYLLKREIGRGGAATVYLAHDVRHERLVAIKVLHTELSHALGTQRFLREIKLTAGLQHPHILSIHDSGEAEGHLYYVMPYVEGDSMRQRLTAEGRLSMEATVRIGREVASALAYAHERGVVHRDIKPENILFSGGHAVLADFGIARAIDRAHEKLTRQGTITGTPAYMSPEQARDRAFDGRSDLYSLACVLYEALAGVPPYVADSPQAMLQHRISRVAPLLREFRPDVPPQIEGVIAKALSISPDDRYADARTFSVALSEAMGASAEPPTVRAVQRPLIRNPWAWATGLSVVLAVSTATSSSARDRLGLLAGRPDSSAYAVVPFTYVGAPQPTPQLEPVAQSIYSSMREWHDLTVASDVRVLDAMDEAGDRSLEDMQEVARSVHAGRLVWGRVWAQHDSLRIRAGLYDAVDGTSVREVTVAGPREQLLSRPGGLSGLVADLLRPEGDAPIAPGAEVGTRSLVAWRAYEDARRAFRAWRMPVATAALRHTIEADPSFAPAHLWLAQVLAWRDAPASEWTPHAAVALRGRALLSARDRRLADALQALAQDQFREACAAYDAMRRADSLDAVAWLGLASCQGLNPHVVRDPRSPTGWSFEGSVFAAEQAYARAVRIAPAAFGAFSFETVVRKLFLVEASQLRRGIGPDSALFVGHPDLVADTIVFVPYRFAQLSTTPGRVMAPHYDRAIASIRDRLSALLATLAQSLPNDPDVFEALGLVLELRDEIAGTPNGGYSALGALERAKMLATDSVQRARLGASDVRLHVKLGDFSRAVSLGDSILAAAPAASGQRAAALAGVAALLGREHDAARLVVASGMSLGLGTMAEAPQVAGVSAALFMRAALGVCDDSLRALPRALTSAIESYEPKRQVARIRDALLERPLVLASECLGSGAMLLLGTPEGLIAQLRELLARGDTARARTVLESHTTSRVTYRPGDISLDRTLSEAQLRVAWRDTSAAIRQLDLALTALPTLRTQMAVEPAMSAALGRSMAYRAELAARTGDRGVAALWAGRVLSLWAHADVSLAPTLARMRQIAAQSR